MQNLVLVSAGMLLAAAPIAAQCNPPPSPAPIGPGPTFPGPGTPGYPGYPVPPGAYPLTFGGSRVPNPFDVTHWSTWWTLNQDAYLGLSDHVHDGAPLTGEVEFHLGAGAALQREVPTAKPSAAALRTHALPVLLAALERKPSHDIAAQAILALAKTGRSLPSEIDELRGVIRPWLAEKNDVLAETAVVALGVLGDPAAMPDLAALLHDEEQGRKLTHKREVPARMRALSALAIGLLGRHSGREDVQRYAVHHLVRGLDEDESVSRDLEVACLTALGLLPLADDGSPIPATAGDRPPTTSRNDQIRFVFDYLKNDLHPRVPRAHAATALARLVSSLPVARRDAWKAVLVPDLLRRLDPRAGEPNEVVQSVVLALGELGDADGDALDRRLRSALEQRGGEHGDFLVEAFSLIALARTGGRLGDGDDPGIAKAAVERHLLTELGRATSRLRPWAGLALGVMGSEETAPSTAGNRALRTAFEGAGSTSDAAAYALALGLRRDRESAREISERLAELKGDDFAAAQLAIALGLLGDSTVRPVLELALQDAYERPDVLLGAAIGLALLDVKATVDDLVVALAEAKTLPRRTAVSAALGRIGDRRAVEPLADFVASRRGTKAARAAAIAALGQVAEPEPRPWKTPLASGLNWAAASATLYDPLGRDILDQP
ncbi:MAG: HEAT repeat domain-containing protein [Planctomycetota bacterium]|nr:HEAT repeat domain-containing protein [Planctomycetota bacterium]